jgi:hypothetical protein
MCLFLKRPLILSHFYQNPISSTDLKKIPKTQFNEKPSNGSRGRQTGALTHIHKEADMKKLIGDPVRCLAKIT